MTVISTVNKVDATFTKLNDATDWISSYNANPNNTLDMGVVLDGSWNGVITLQKRQVINGVATTEVPVAAIASSCQRKVEDDIASVEYRLKCTSFTAGTAYVELYK